MEPAVRRQMELHWASDADRCTLASAFEPAVADAEARGYGLPESFLRFMRSPDLQRRVPSPTACYFDAPERVVEAPAPGDGILVRFLNDQQWCAHWYLYVERGGAHAVVTSPHTRGLGAVRARHRASCAHPAEARYVAEVAAHGARHGGG